MNRDFWAQVENAYLEAAEMPGEQRTPFLEKVYRDRPDIRTEVESLLQHKEAAEHLTQSSIVVSAASLFDDDDDLIGTIVGGKYRVRECIGSGGQADVYLADHIALDSSFALKRAAPVLRKDPEFRQRFLEEARRAVVLRHDNVARVHDVLESGGEMFVVMEHIDGETLRQRLERLRRPLTVEEFLPIAIQCAAALAAAHEKRIVHLDVKPENIMLTTDERVKICDFGIARRLSAKSNTDTSDARTPDWTFAGTPAYMAPEVILSYQFDERADLFSLGTVFYEMLTGRNPFLASTGPATTARVVSEPAAPINNPEVGRKLETIVMRLLEKDPAKRLADAGELLKELDAFCRSRSRFVDLLTGIQEAFAEHIWLKIAATAVVLSLAASPLAWVYRHRIERFVSTTPFPGKNIVVVLPFQIVGNSRDEKFYSEGFSELLTDNLKQQLASVRDLQIVSPNEVRDRKVDSAQKARGEFGATIILAGSFQFFNDQLRISYRFIRGTDFQEVRFSSKTILVADPFKIQDLVIQDLLASLESELSSRVRGAAQVFGTNNTKAFFIYTEGRGAIRNSFDPQNLDLAINLFNQASDVDPQYAEAYASLGQAYWLKYRALKQDSWLNLAAQACEKALSVNQKLSEAHSCLGLVSETRGDYENAIEDYNRALNQSSRNDEAYLGLGRVLEQLGQFDDAENALLKAVGSRQYWASHMWIAAFYNRALHNYSKAIEHYNLALALSPDNGQVLTVLGGAYANAGQYDMAIPILQNAVQVRPYLPDAYSNLGMSLLWARRFREAVAPLEHAAKVGEDYRATGNLARSYWLTGDFDKARQALELAINQGNKIILTNPRDHGAHLLLGRYYAMLGKKPEAVSHINLALRDRPNDQHYLTTAAVSYLRLGDRNNALSLLEQAVAHGAKIYQIKAESELDVLAAEPRYIALLTTIQNQK